MPLFGNRIVVGTANYKHIKEKKKEFFERETRLGRWVSERKERKDRLRELNERIRSRQGSIVSTNSAPEFDVGGEEKHDNDNLGQDGIELKETVTTHNKDTTDGANTKAAANIPDTQFMVDDQDMKRSNRGKNPCLACSIQ